MADIALAVDIGGTKLAACLVRPDGTVSAHRTIPTPHGDADVTWKALAELLTSISAGVPVTGIGVGSAGPTDPLAGTVSPVNIPGWRDFPLLTSISRHFPGVSIRLAGDGICAAAGEHWLGAGRGHDDLLVMVVSTGVGGGLIQAGRLVQGPSGNAGHIGHMVIDFAGERCPCGGRGCVEAYASGPSMVRWAIAHGWPTSTTSPTGMPRHPVFPSAAKLGHHLAMPSAADLAALAPVHDPALPSAVDLAASARSGDVVALAAFARAGAALAAGIVSTAAICDVSRAVIGGGVARAADILLPPLRESLAAHGKLGFLRDLTVTTAALGSRAGLLGAAALVLDPDRYQ